MASTTGLLDLPTEILQYILRMLTTPSYQQTTLVCKKLYYLASTSRSVVLHHLHAVPGIKTGLDDLTISPSELFLLFRQRASKHLYGANFTADCLELRVRNAQLDVDASCLSNLDKDYITMSIVFRNTQTIRLYSTKCHLKERIESPFCGGKTRILQVVHKSTIAVLYQWEPEAKQKSPPWLDKALVREHAHKKPNNIHIISPPTSDTEDTDDEDEEPPKVENIKKFHLQIYDSLSADRPTTYTIEQHKKLVPRHLAYCSRLLWAILWDIEGSSHPTTECEIVQYTAPIQPVPLGEASYDSRVVWPNEFDPAPVLLNSDIAKGLARKIPKKIAFFKEGRRLSLYAAGDIVPFKVLGVGSIRESRLPINSVHFENQTLFYVDKSFYGSHESYYDPIEARQVCTLTHLCLGVSEILHPTRKYKILCILRSRSKLDHDDCPHVVSKDRMNHVSAENCKAVARLWGWSQQASTLTGLDTVAISAHGTRIAIAQWNRILVWSLDPKMLCEEIPEFDAEDESKKLKRRNRVKLDHLTDGFYERVRDPQMGWKIANLKPIVIDLNGAIARKMAWSDEHEKSDEDSDDESEVEPCTAEASNNETSMAVPEPLNQSSNAGVDATGHDEVAVVAADQSPSAEELLLPSGVSGVDTDIHLDDHPGDIFMQQKVEIKEPMQQKGHTIDGGEGVIVKPVFDRSLPVTGSPRCRQVLSPEKLPGGSDAVEFKIETAGDAENTHSVAGPAAATQVEIDPGVIEALPSPLDKHSSEPKGKEKESDKVVVTASSGSIKSPTNLVPAKIKKMVRKKRFTEDHLVIVTDRGFQTWDFGVHSRRRRVTKWLEED